MPKTATELLEGRSMGTGWRVTLDGPVPERDRLHAECQATVDLVDRQMSTWKPDSDLMRLNAAPLGEWVTLPPELPVPLHPVVEEVRQSLLADLPKMLDAAVPIRKLFQQTPAFMGRYFWLNSGLAEVDQHERSASATWKKVTDGNDDEGALLTLFLCVAAGSPPKTLLTDRTAGTLIRKIRKTGLNPELATQYIQAHAPVAYQADYLKLWHGFLDEATATLTRDVDDGIQSALALLRRECHVKAS